MPVHGHGTFSPRGGETEYREPGGSIRPRIQQYRALKGLPRAEDALQLLRRVGAEVKGIMRKHDWTLPLLTEFSGFSKNGTAPDLLGMNRNSGQVIYLRLRHPTVNRALTDSFLPFEDIMGTMLHELAHNSRGPHDEIFYKILEGLEEEWYEMKRNGGWMEGDGFESHGRTLGSLEGLGPASGNVPIRLVGQKAAEAAEKRRRYEELSRGGPRRLGGLSSTGVRQQATSMPSSAAAQAAERRRRSEQSCPSTQSAREGAVKWHEEEDLVLGVKVITFDEEDDEGTSPSVGVASSASHFSKAGQVEEGAKEPIERDPPGARSRSQPDISQAITIDSSSSEDESDSADFIVVKESIKRRPTAASSSTKRPLRPPAPAPRLRGQLNISARVAEQALKAMREERAAEEAMAKRFG